MAATGLPKQSGDGAIGALILEMHVRRTSYWVWHREVWLEILCARGQDFRDRYRWTSKHARHALATATYLLGLFDDFRALGLIDRTALACRIFGRERIEAQIKQVIDVIRLWGFSRFMAKDIQWALCIVLLANKSPNLHDLNTEILRAERDVATVHYRAASITILSSALKHLGAIQQALDRRYGHTRLGDAKKGVDPVWGRVGRALVSDIHDSTEQSRTDRYLLLKAGRWLTQTHPDCTSPDRWTRDLAAEWVAAVCRMTRWEWVQIEDKYKRGVGQPLSAKAKAHHLSSVSAFFRDIQEWGWIPRRDPRDRSQRRAVYALSLARSRRSSTTVSGPSCSGLA